MTSFTFDTLQDSIFAYTEDDGDDITDNIETIMQNGQEKVVRELDLEIFKATVPGSFEVGSSFVNKDSSFLVIESFHYVNASNKLVRLQKRSLDFCYAYWPTLTDTGAPRFYAENSDTQFLVVKTPDAAYAWKQRGIVRPTPLSATNEYNWISRNCGDLLLYACLIESEKFLMAVNTGRVAEWKEEYAARIPYARRELQELARHEFSPLAPGPTIKDER